MVLDLVEAYKDLTKEEMKKKISFYRSEIKKDEGKVNKYLPDVFALGYITIQRIHKISLFKVQLMGGFILHQGDIAEMKTGEGKTLTAILPSLLNSLSGKGVYIVTVNEYLCKRDAQNSEKVLSYLGVSVGYVLKDFDLTEKKENYSRDVVYITNSELGFDFLRDNMASNKNLLMQKDFNFCIIDEADSILIDESRTPLIIAGGNLVEKSEYIKTDEFVKTLKKEDYILDGESKSVSLTISGIKKAEDFFELGKLFEFSNSLLVHRIQNALNAVFIYKNDVDYVVKNNEIILVDIFTGRLLPGRSFSEGLNQAIEAKEATEIKPETKIMASITYQNLFRLFKKISGMTGTALTEEEEFMSTYNSKVIQIPTNEPIIRKDLSDVIFSTKKTKFENVIKRIVEIHETGQPILVGTRSLYDSELISRFLTEENITHEVLNAKNDFREADIVANAGKKNSITISTNMAGRGTDIRLGEGVIELGGLFVLGTERHEARRIDDQLRGRSGRQGDIGYSQFYVSLEDEILVRAGFTKLKRFLKYTDDNPIASKSITRAITSAQKRIEGLNYDYRKSTIEYDDAVNQQRIIIYNQRKQFLQLENKKEIFYKILRTFISYEEQTKNAFINDSFSSSTFINWAKELIGDNDSKYFVNSKKETLEKTIEYVYKCLVNFFEDIFSRFEKIEQVNNFLLRIMIGIIDELWRNQLNELSKLRQSIRYIQYSQKNPLQAYIFRADRLFRKMKFEISEKIILAVINFKSSQIDSSVVEEDTKIREVKDFVVS